MLPGEAGSREGSKSKVGVKGKKSTFCARPRRALDDRVTLRRSGPRQVSRWKRGDQSILQLRKESLESSKGLAQGHGEWGEVLEWNPG